MCNAARPTAADTHPVAPSPMLQTCNAAVSTPLLAPDRYNDEHCTVAERPARAAITRKGFPWPRSRPPVSSSPSLARTAPASSPASPAVLGEANVDIRDITQSIIEDIFTMTMLARHRRVQARLRRAAERWPRPASFRASTCPSSARTSLTLCTACSEQAARGSLTSYRPSARPQSGPGEERAWPTTPRKSTTASTIT